MPLNPRFLSIRFWWLAFGLVVLAVAAEIVSFLWWCLPGTYHPGQELALPVRYSAGRFYAEPVTASGVKLSLLTDTGGGMFLTKGAVERCGLRPVTLLSLNRVRLPAFQPDSQIPEPTGAERWMPVVSGDGDGMLGQRWFAGGVWTFDYPARKLVLHRSGFFPDPELARHAAPLGFHRDWGIRTGNHPRFAVSIAGETVECLFDTGATVWLSPEAQRVLSDPGPSERATSFVAASLFERWRKAHPTWRVIEKGCQRTGAALIEVPEVEVAGFKVGPVWFTHRSQPNFTWMSSFMAGPISASMGGNFLEHFRVTVDYPKAVAYFQMP